MTLFLGSGLRSAADPLVQWIARKEHPEGKSAHETLIQLGMGQQINVIDIQWTSLWSPP